MAIALLVIYGAIFVFTTKQIAYYYPYEDDQTIYFQSESYLYNHTSCREWARDKAREQGEARDGLYGCGRRCVFDQRQEYYQCNKMSVIRPIYEEYNTIDPQTLLGI